jgi:hypothetical protein
VAAATVANYLDVYFPGAKTQLDVISTSLYTELVANAAASLEFFNHDFLTDSQIVQAQALLVAIDCGGMPGLAGWSQERHYQKLKVADRTWSNTDTKDWAIGEFCRLLKITLPEYTAKTSTVREAQFNVYKTNSLFISEHPLDQRARVFRDYELDDSRTEQEANPRIKNYYPLDNRY